MNDCEHKYNDAGVCELCQKEKTYNCTACGKVVFQSETHFNASNEPYCKACFADWGIENEV